MGGSRDKLDICLTILDSLMAYFVFFPMVCLYWRGSWDLIGYYVLPEHVPYNYWVHAAIGSCSVFDYLIIPLLDRNLDRNKKVLWKISNLQSMELRLFLILGRYCF